MTVAEVQRRVSGLEFAEWIAFYSVEADPMGEDHPPRTQAELGDKIRSTFEAIKLAKAMEKAR